LFTENKHENYINKFETVNYDREALKEIQNKLQDKEDDWKLSDFDISEEKQTLSIKRILFALNFFKRSFKKELQKQNIKNYIGTFLNAHISTHVTTDKAVAVQIFELQNTRGISLDLIEKVKAKLMKAIYLQDSHSETTIKIIQNNFAEIYKLEEQISESSFRGDLPLEEILNYHLRMVDDGSKLTQEKPDFRQPSIDNREESILTYLDKRISESENAVSYIVDLVERFKQTVQFLSVDLRELDTKNNLIGDVMILSKFYSTHLFILIYHKFKSDISLFFKDIEIFKLWERLLFTSNFHEKYYRQIYRDNYEWLYTEIIKIDEITRVKDIIYKFVKNGFREDLFEDNNLQKTVSKFVSDEKEQILTNAFYFFNDKMVYALYKYEIDQKANLKELRKIIKEGRSVEHILPQNWQWEWINENPQKRITNKGNKFNKSINNVINGLGNLLLLTPSENSSQSNNHPKNKVYKCCSGGSYEEHNASRNNWSEPNNWKSKIEERGEKIYNFMLHYFQLNKS
ncbi:MAG: DUF1524 domain-containing protein, partial [Bacteroidales bacterium]|nr:DUF1524 domain-containing protein [Bacteroidales bacterium]